MRGFPDAALNNVFSVATGHEIRALETRAKSASTPDVDDLWEKRLGKQLEDDIFVMYG